MKILSFTWAILIYPETKFKFYIKRERLRTAIIDHSLLQMVGYCRLETFRLNKEFTFRLGILSFK